MSHFLLYSKVTGRFCKCHWGSLFLLLAKSELLNRYSSRPVELPAHGPDTTHTGHAYPGSTKAQNITIHHNTSQYGSRCDQVWHPWGIGNRCRKAFDLLGAVYFKLFQEEYNTIILFQLADCFLKNIASLYGIKIGTVTQILHSPLKFRADSWINLCWYFS